MQLIKSLFCWQGFDNRSRFIVISLSCFFTFMIVNQGLSDYKLSVTVILLLCSLICLATTRRRVNDTQLGQKWILVPAISFFITGLMIIFISPGASYWLLVVPLLLSLLLLTYPSKSQKQYILGYFGPVNLTEFKPIEKVNVRNNQRVEPTMNSINVAHMPINKSSHSSLADNAEHNSTTIDTFQSPNNAQKVDIGETIRVVLFSPKHIRITFALVGLLIVLVMSLILSNPPSDKQAPQEQKKPVQEASNDFQHQLTLPDNFSIMTSPDKGLVIRWQANVKDNGEVWMLASATGDKSCKEIAFNKEDVIRTYSVSVIDSEYYAYFSPLDTKALIKNIAFKNNFSLCGYNFSLTGSQVTLGKSPFYANLIDY